MNFTPTKHSNKCQLGQWQTRVLLPRGGLIWELVSVILLHQPKASSRPSVEQKTLVLQWTQLYSLWGFQSFCGIYIALFSLPPHLVEIDFDWEARQHRPPVPLLLWCKSGRKVLFLATVVKSQPHVSLFGFLHLTGIWSGFTHWWYVPFLCQTWGNRSQVEELKMPSLLEAHWRNASKLNP